MMTSRERFSAALSGTILPRPPVWLMRQAGRYLPEYRALKEQHGFLKMVKTPELATEVTLQPMRRYALDAAILFSDILVIPEAMGQPYHFMDKGGIAMEYVLQTEAQIDALNPARVCEHLDYTRQALNLIRQTLGTEKALLGFSGSPWTLACYMVEGGSSRDFSKIKGLYYGNRPLFEKLMFKISDAVATHLLMQWESGVDAVQIFDSWAQLCPVDEYEGMSLRWIHEIRKRLPAEVRLIYYAKGMMHRWPQMMTFCPNALSVDWTLSLPELRAQVPETIAIQGNLDPVLLTTTPEIVRRATLAMLESMNGKPGYIFNLGHGMIPEAKVECVQTLVETINTFGA
jgi:uroporphyrinogen decarboxylase